MTKEELVMKEIDRRIFNSLMGIPYGIVLRKALHITLNQLAVDNLILTDLYDVTSSEVRVMLLPEIRSIDLKVEIKGLTK